MAWEDEKSSPAAEMRGRRQAMSAAGVFRELFVRVVDHDYSMSEAEEATLRRFNSDATKATLLGGITGFGMTYMVLRYSKYPRLRIPTSIMGSIVGGLMVSQSRVDGSLAELASLPHSRLALESRIIITERDGVDGPWQQKHKLRPFYDMLADVWAEQPPEIQKEALNQPSTGDHRVEQGLADVPDWARQIHPSMRVGPRLSSTSVPERELLRELELRRLKDRDSRAHEHDAEPRRRSEKIAGRSREVELTAPQLDEPYDAFEGDFEAYDGPAPRDDESSGNWAAQVDVSDDEGSADFGVSDGVRDDSRSAAMTPSQRRAAERRERRELARRHALASSNSGEPDLAVDPTLSDSFVDDWDPARSNRDSL
mmetsp:Transcript_14645/g.39208  ORF Transcript_14645/g.39208 Transcript_14645/m.39208 type:complete len:369 (+) Transcript_14645:888-1994(+)